MTRWTLIASASLVVNFAAGIVAADRALAASQQNIGMRVTSSDETARFLTLGVNKSVVVDLPKDVQDVLVTDPKTANAVVRTKRRAYLIGVAPGETNVYLFDQGGRQIGALDIEVVSGSPQPPSEQNPSGGPANVVVVYRSAEGATYSCTPTACLGAVKPDTTTYSQITTISK